MLVQTLFWGSPLNPACRERWKIYQYINKRSVPSIQDLDEVKADEGQVRAEGEEGGETSEVGKIRPVRRTKKCYDPPTDEDDIGDISGDDSDDDPQWGVKTKYYMPAKKSVEGNKGATAKKSGEGNKGATTTTTTPPVVFKGRRDKEFEKEWRNIGGHTPEAGKQKYGTFNWKVFELLVHHHAKLEKIDLSTGVNISAPPRVVFLAVPLRREGQLYRWPRH